MKHSTKEGVIVFAVHEVYFDEKNEIITYTEDALSPRENSVDKLKVALKRLLMQPGEEVICGDFHYSYSKETLEYWLSQIDLPIIDYV
jgi:hypothetical protein